MTFQGRLSEQLFPYGIYTIPEISMIGKTETQLTSEGVPYEVRTYSLSSRTYSRRVDIPSEGGPIDHHSSPLPCFV